MATMPDRPSASRFELPIQDGRRLGVQVIERAAGMLRLLKRNPAGLTQAEIADRLNLARTTVHRIISALAEEGLVASGAGGRHRLGQEILSMAEVSRSALITELHPLLQALSDEIEETVDLAVLERGKLTFIDQAVARQRLCLVGVIGSRFPLHCTANGKAMLAALPSTELNKLLESSFEAYTEHTITSPDRLRANLDEIRACGVAIDQEEHSAGICAIGVALKETPLGLLALSVPIPSLRFEAKRSQATDALFRVGVQVLAHLNMKTLG